MHRALFLIWLLGTSCTPNDQSGNAVHFATSSESLKKSILNNFAISPPVPIEVCIAQLQIGTEGKFKSTPVTNERDFFRRIQVAFQSWFDLLADGVGWPRSVTASSHVKLGDNASCFTQGKFSLTRVGFLYADAGAWQSLLSKSPSLRTKTYIDDYFIRFEPEQWNNQAVLVHEIGHLLGLLDVYGESEFRRRFSAKNPPALMGEHRPQEGRVLTEDDKRGVLAVWNAIKGVVFSCGENYKENDFAGREKIETEGFVHCMPTESVAGEFRRTNGSFCDFGSWSEFLPNEQVDLPKCTNESRSILYCPAGFERTPVSDRCFPVSKRYELLCPTESLVYDPHSGLCIPKDDLRGSGVAPQSVK